MQRDLKDRSVQVSVEQRWASDLERFANKDEPSTSSTRIRKIQKIVWGLGVRADALRHPAMRSAFAPLVWGALRCFIYAKCPYRGQVTP